MYLRNQLPSKKEAQLAEDHRPLSHKNGDPIWINTTTSSELNLVLIVESRICCIVEKTRAAMSRTFWA